MFSTDVIKYNKWITILRQLLKFYYARQYVANEFKMNIPHYGRV